MPSPPCHHRIRRLGKRRHPAPSHPAQLCGSGLTGEFRGQHSEPGSACVRGAKSDELHLTPLELIDRIAALIPPPRTHRHRYFGVLAPNSPLREVVTAMAAAPAQPASAARPQLSTQSQPGTHSVSLGDGSHSPAQPGLVHVGASVSEPAQPPPPPKRPAHYLWAVLIARIYEVFPLICPICGGPMHITSLHHPQCRHPAHPRPHRGGIRAAPHCPGTRAAAVG
jgi:hypothetical protein